MNRNPLVSIIIPVYNGANYLALAIDSALAQTYKNIEIVVINDGSPDNGETEKIALSYGSKIRYIYKSNGGVSSALNTGIKEMKGEYFSWLSHDDLYEPNKIEKQISLIQTENDIIICSGSQVDPNRNPIPLHIRTLDGVFTGMELFTKRITGLYEYGLNGLGFLIPKHVFDKVGYFDETMRYIQDYDMWLRIMMVDKYRFICHRELLVITRIHREQHTNKIPEAYYEERKILAVKHLNLIKADENIRNKNKWYELYYKMFVREDNSIGKKVYSKLLKEEGISELKLFFISIPFYIYGNIKKSVKKCYATILKMKRLRD